MSVGLPCVCMCVGRFAFCVHVHQKVRLLCTMCVSRSCTCVYMKCQTDLTLVCTCVSVGLPCVYMCVGRSALAHASVWSVCNSLCTCVLVSLTNTHVHVCWSVWPCVCMCVRSVWTCVCMYRSACTSVCMCVGQSAFMCTQVQFGPTALAHTCVLVGRPCVCKCVGRSALCVHVYE